MSLDEIISRDSKELPKRTTSKIGPLGWCDDCKKRVAEMHFAWVYKHRKCGHISTRSAGLSPKDYLWCHRCNSVCEAPSFIFFSKPGKQ